MRTQSQSIVFTTHIQPVPKPPIAYMRWPTYRGGGYDPTVPHDDLPPGYSYLTDSTGVYYLLGADGAFLYGVA